MTLFGDFYFFGWLLIWVIPAIIMGVREVPLKYYGFVATIFFIFMSMGNNTTAVLYLALYCVLEIGLLKCYLKIVNTRGRSQIAYWLFLLLALLPLIVFKAGGILGTNIFAFMGISYMSFKTVQMVIEIYDGLIERLGVFETLYFLIFFPCLSSGPIDRSRRFHNDCSEKISREEYLENLGFGLFKITLGMTYKMVLGTVIYQLMAWCGAKGTLMSELIYFYGYGIYLFFDFAGYSSMAVGASYIFGVKSPDNFNKPFISKDIKEFWDRWHISLSHWFRDFLFSRLMMRATRGKWFSSKLTKASFGFIVNMGVMGVWHGLDIYYIIYGLYHGILLSLTEIYQKKSKFHKLHKKDRWYIAVEIIITFNLVMFGFYIFSGRFTQIMGI